MTRSSGRRYRAAGSMAETFVISLYCSPSRLLSRSCDTCAKRQKWRDARFRRFSPGTLIFVGLQSARITRRFTALLLLSNCPSSLYHKLQTAPHTYSDSDAGNERLGIAFSYLFQRRETVRVMAPRQKCTCVLVALSALALACARQTPLHGHSRVGRLEVRLATLPCSSLEDRISCLGHHQRHAFFRDLALVARRAFSTTQAIGRDSMSLAASHVPQYTTFRDSEMPASHGKLRNSPVSLRQRQGNRYKNARHLQIKGRKV